MYLTQHDSIVLICVRFRKDDIRNEGNHTKNTGDNNNRYELNDSLTTDQTNESVDGVMLINNEGIPLETTMDHDTTVQVKKTDYHTP
jgi:hypothetical protein